MKIAVITTDGFEEVELVGTIGILRRGGVAIDIYSLHGNEAKGRYGVKLIDLKEFKDFNKEDYDMLFIAGGPEYKELEKNDEFLDILTYFMKNKKVAAICAAPTIIGKLGLLKGRRYTCFTSMNEDFGGTYIDKYFVKDGNLITGRSAAATIDFAFAVLEEVTNKEHADEVKKSIYY
jgi:putative intracellular protease/amidase